MTSADSVTPCDPNELKTRLLSGISITKLGLLIGRSSAGTYKVIERLENAGYISRLVSHDDVSKKEIVQIKLTKPDIQSEELFGIVYRPRRPRDNNFVAPDLSPRISEAVALRLRGMSETQIAEQMGVSPHTVSLYLTLARHPEKIIKYRERKVPDNSASIDRIFKLLQRDGFVFSGDCDIPRFNDCYRHFLVNQLGICVQFPSQKKYYGTLSNNKAIYSDDNKFADFVANKLFADVFVNFKGFRRKEGGRTLSRKTFTYRLSEIFVTDRAMISKVWNSLEKLGVVVDANRNIQVNAQKAMIILTEQELDRMKGITQNIQLAVTSSGNLYKECKAFTNFFERLAKRHGFEPSKVHFERDNWKLEQTVS